MDLTALERELEDTQARLSRIIGQADHTLASIRRRRRTWQAILAATR